MKNSHEHRIRFTFGHRENRSGCVCLLATGLRFSHMYIRRQLQKTKDTNELQSVWAMDSLIHLGCAGNRGEIVASEKSASSNMKKFPVNLWFFGLYKSLRHCLCPCNNMVHWSHLRPEMRQHKSNTDVLYTLMLHELLCCPFCLHGSEGSALEKI